jgi:hypothetical protein
MTQSRSKGLRNRYDVTQDEFCRVWEQAQSVQEVCEKLGMPANVVMTRASSYRNKEGVQLKKFGRGRPRAGMQPHQQGTSVDELNQVILSIKKQMQVRSQLHRLLGQIIATLTKQ